MLSDFQLYPRWVPLDITRNDSQRRFLAQKKHFLNATFREWNKLVHKGDTRSELV